MAKYCNPLNLVTVVRIKKTITGWVYLTKDKDIFFLPEKKVGKLTLIDENLMNFVNSGNPITKYFESSDGIITYVANLVVDAVPVKDWNKVYLINRKDGRGWSVPGGFINENEGVHAAMIREFVEETNANPDDILETHYLVNMKATDPREINVFTYPYLLILKNTATLHASDDAVDGKWVTIDDAIGMKLAFEHHNKLLIKTKDYINHYDIKFN